jgi:hypothetical protein
MSERLRILGLIENGEISAEEGAELLKNADSIKSDPAKKTSEMKILEMIERGEISPEAGVEMLTGSKNEDRSDTEPLKEKVVIIEDEPTSSQPNLDREAKKWRQWWLIPAWLGVGVMVLSAWWMYSAFQASGLGFWFFVSWIPLLLSSGFVALLWPSANRPWVHVRVNQEKGESPQRIAISIPLPIKFAAWALRTFGHYIPTGVQNKFDASSLDELILALGDSTKNGSPIHIKVDEGEDGERVEVFIG